MRKNWESIKEMYPAHPGETFRIIGENTQEPVLLEFLDTFSFEAFLSNPSYRQRLNEILETFTDEEFDKFEHRHARRFTLN
jgi:hypothetical protein